MGMHPRLPAVLRSQRTEESRCGTSPTDHDADVLLAACLERDRCSGDAHLGVERPELRARDRIVGVEPSVGLALEDQTAIGRHRPAVPEPRCRHRPGGPLPHGIPCEQCALAGIRRCITDRHCEPSIELRALHAEALRVYATIIEKTRHLERRDVHQSGLRVERHRLPIVHPHGRRPDQRRCVFITGARHLDRPPGGEVDALRPSDLAEFLGRQHLAGLAVDHIEESVLRCMQDHRTRLAADLERRKRDVHRRVVVPGLARGRLVVPHVLAGVRIERDDRTKKKVVAAARTTDLAVPRRTVAGADVHPVVRGIVGHRVPGLPTATELPPVTGPGLGRHLHRGVLEALSRVTRHDPEPPELLARVRIIGRDIAAVGAELAARVADDDLAVEDPRRACDGQLVVRIHRLSAPDLPTIARIEGDQPSVSGADIDLAFPVADAARTPSDAQLALGDLGDLRIVAPEQTPRACFDGVHDALPDREIDDAVDRKRHGRAIGDARQIK